MFYYYESFVKKTQNIGTMAEKKLGEFATPNNDYLRTPIAQPTIDAEDYEIKPHYLSLVNRINLEALLLRTQVCT